MNLHERKLKCSCPTDNQVAISGCPLKFSCQCLWPFLAKKNKIPESVGPILNFHFGHVGRGVRPEGLYNRSAPGIWGLAELIVFDNT